MLIHSGEKQYECPHCQHKSALKHNLIKHIRKAHGDMLADAYKAPFHPNWSHNINYNSSSDFIQSLDLFQASQINEVVRKYE